MTKTQIKKAIQNWVQENYGDDDSWNIEALSKHLYNEFKKQHGVK